MLLEKLRRMGCIKSMRNELCFNNSIVEKSIQINSINFKNFKFLAWVSFELF